MFICVYKKFDRFISVYKKIDMFINVSEKFYMFICVYKKFDRFCINCNKLTNINYPLALKQLSVNVFSFADEQLF